LKAAGASVWLDQLDIVPGQRWDSAVEDALANCPRMLVILSPASVNSTNVMDEVSFALDEKKTVIPVIHQDCKIPFRLRRVQYVDFRHDYARGLKELLKTLGPERKKLNDLVAILADPKSDTPVFEEAVRFADSEPNHRKSLIHRWQARLESKDALSVKGNWPAVALSSEYDFDRIAAYLYQEKRNPPEAGAAMAAVSREYEKRRIHKDGSYMPLHYSLRALSASHDAHVATHQPHRRHSGLFEWYQHLQKSHKSSGRARSHRQPA
jgi:TIR domain